MSAPKSIVFFEKSGLVVIGYSAELYNVTNHPLLGDAPWVRTSNVVDIRDNGDTIETLNTIYKKVMG